MNDVMMNAVAVVGGNLTNAVNANVDQIIKLLSMRWWCCWCWMKQHYCYCLKK